MRAVRFQDPHRPFTLVSVPIPEPQNGDVRVRVQACGMCRTELHLRDGLLDLGRRDFTVGHEIAGVIEAVGDGVDPARLGERVVVYYYEGCGTCAYCRRGDEQLCPAPRRQPGFTTDGGYAEWVVSPARNCVQLPDHVSFAEAAPLGCAGSTAVHATRLANVGAGDWVVVNGIGGVGFALLQTARARGARVIAVALGADRAALANELGAAAVIDAAAVHDVAAEVASITGEGADIVFELVGTEATMRAATTMLRRRGRLVLIGYTGENFVVHPVELIVRELAVLGSVGSTLEDLREAVDLLAKGVLRSPVDRTLPLEQFETGLHAIEHERLLGRIVLQPNDPV